MSNNNVSASDARKDDIISSLTGALLMLGMTPDQISSFTGADMDNYVELAHKKYDLDNVEEHLKSLCFTVEGLLETDTFLKEAVAKRKRLQDAGLVDEDDDTELPSFGAIISEADIYLGEDGFDNEYVNGWGISDDYDADYPICLQVGKHLHISNTDSFMWTGHVVDRTGNKVDERLYIQDFAPESPAYVSETSRNTTVRAAICRKGFFDESTIAEKYLHSNQLGGWFQTEHGSVFVVVDMV